MAKSNKQLTASFRDPSGFLFWRDGILYRQVNKSYQADYDLLLKSGLYKELTKKGLLIAHKEVELQGNKGYKVLRPDIVPFISYPYEWSFSQLQDAALATLEIQKLALAKGMNLKDASAYNIQFVDGRPLLIDTLSFEKYEDGSPWVAYRQFCQHFLAPLALMAMADIRLSQLLRVYIDGIPLDLASKLLPRSSKLRPGIAMHVTLHARSQAKHAASGKKTSKPKLPKQRLAALIDSLESAVRHLQWRPPQTTWGDYYETHSYDDGSFGHKQQLVGKYIKQAAPKTVWDLGGNAGTFSRIASELGIETVCFDNDEAAIEANYRKLKADKELRLLPLILDLTNPSNALGWAGTERMSLAERGPADLVMALALVHHLAISNNVPLSAVAEFCRGLGAWLIIEFVPKEDPMVQRLLSSREDIFPDYTRRGFEAAFANYFEITDACQIEGSERWLYLMKGRREAV